MRLSPSGVFVSAHEEVARKKLRYAGVSVASIPIGQGMIQALGAWLDNYAAASLIASAIITVPLFYANKRFVWRVAYGENLRRQVLIFWVVMMSGATLTTLFTWLVDKEMNSQTTFIRGTAVLFAQVLGLSIVWVGRYIVLDRWLFKLADDTPADLDGVVGERSV